MAAVLVSILAAGFPTASASAEGAPNPLDLSFGSCGVAVVNPYDFSGGHAGTATGVDVQSDGKVIVAGGVSFASHYLARITADGTMDYSFGYNGSVVAIGDNHRLDVVVQPDDRIVVGGHQSANGVQYISRHLRDGASDPSFGSDGSASVPAGVNVSTLALQPDGMVLGGGDQSLVRLSAGGVLDRSFGTEGIVSLPGSLTALAVHDDGRIVVGLTVWGATPQFGVLQLRPDGSPDPRFAGGAVVVQGNTRRAYVAVDGQGRVLLGGTMMVDMESAAIALARFLPDGRPDPGFGDAGVVISQPGGAAAVWGMSMEPDGKIVVATGGGKVGLARFTVDGDLDVAFGSMGVRRGDLGGRSGLFEKLVRTSDGGFVQVGYVGSSMSAAVRFRGPGPAPATPTPATCTKVLTLSPTTFRTEYGQVKSGMSSAAKTFTVTSSGTAPIRVRKVAISFEHAPEFVISSDTCTGATVAPGASCLVSVKYAPTLKGPHWSRLLVWSDADMGVHGTDISGTPIPAFPTHVIGWGWNGYGQLGRGTVAVRPTVPVGFGDASAVASGYFHGAYLKDDGTVWTTGWNHFGQLGDGTTVDRHEPVAVAGLTDVTAISAGAYHTLALKGDRSVWAWGLNNVGQLGDGTTTDRWTPVQVGTLPWAAQIAAGGLHSVAVLFDGTVQAWGWNGFGQLGDGSTVDRHEPVTVTGLTGVTDVAAGAFHNLAVSAGGTIEAWGYNGFGQLGDGTTIDRQTPVTVPGVSLATDVAAGAYHSLALGADGTVRGWGLNNVGQLGDGSATNRSRPVAVRNLQSVVKIASGFAHSMAIEAGTAKAWGWNYAGQLGDRTSENRSTPVPVVGMGLTTAVAGGVLHSFAA
ncbi:MAG TPA: choice-of-anchor D domain-containing protein [Acidimicrobiales bacterium]|nr:choice-of-anchor D domain-containing protein [Acidimicrobiales bacterium]